MSLNTVVCLEMLDYAAQVPTTSTVVDWVRSSEYLDPNNYDGAGYYFEALIQGTSGLVYSLVDETNNAVVATITTNATGLKRYRSTSFTPNSGNCLYKLRTPSIASGTCDVWHSRIVVVQTGATKTRVSVAMIDGGGSANSDDAGTTGYLSRVNGTTYALGVPTQQAIWPYTAANWATLASASLEVIHRSSSATYTTYSALCDTSNNVIAAIATTNGSWEYATAAVSLSDGVQYEVRQKGDGTRYNQTVKQRLYLTLTSLSNGETYWRQNSIATRTSNYERSNGLAKIDTSLYSSPVVYNDVVGFLASAENYPTGHSQIDDHGTSDTAAAGGGPVA